MTHHELQNAFAAIRVPNIEQTVALTGGGVPLYVLLLLTTDEDDDYEDDIDASVKDLLRRLRYAHNENDWKEICLSVFASLLESKTSAALYDKKFFFIASKKPRTTRFKYKALLPSVPSSMLMTAVDVWKATGSSCALAPTIDEEEMGLTLSLVSCWWYLY
jgi:hypothetical protein